MQIKLSKEDLKTLNVKDQVYLSMTYFYNGMANSIKGVIAKDIFWDVENHTNMLKDTAKVIIDVIKNIDKEEKKADKKKKLAEAKKRAQAKQKKTQKKESKKTQTKPKHK